MILPVPKPLSESETNRSPGMRAAAWASAPSAKAATTTAEVIERNRRAILFDFTSDPIAAGG